MHPNSVTAAAYNLLSHLSYVHLTTSTVTVVQTNLQHLISTAIVLWTRPNKKCMKP